MLTFWAEPVDFDSVVTYEELDVEQNYRKTVELIRQPEVSEPNVVERSRHNAKLKHRKPRISHDETVKDTDYNIDYVMFHCHF